MSGDDAKSGRAAYGLRLQAVVAAVHAAIQAGRAGACSAELSLASGLTKRQVSTHLAVYVRYGYLQLVEADGVKLWAPGLVKPATQGGVRRKLKPASQLSAARQDRQAAEAALRAKESATPALRRDVVNAPAQSVAMGPDDVLLGVEARPGGEVRRFRRAADGVVVSVYVAGPRGAFTPDPAVLAQPGSYSAQWAHLRRAGKGGRCHAGRAV